MEIKDPRYGLTITSPDLLKHSDASADGRPMSGGIVPHVMDPSGRAQPGFDPNKPGVVVIDPGSDHACTIDLTQVNVDRLNQATAGGMDGISALKQAAAAPPVSVSHVPSSNGSVGEPVAVPSQRVIFDFPGAGEFEALYHEVLVSESPTPSLLLVYDTRFQHGVRYFPPVCEKAVAVQVPGGAMYLVWSYGIRHTLGPLELCVLLIEQSRSSGAGNGDDRGTTGGQG